MCFSEKRKKHTGDHFFGSFCNFLIRAYISENYDYDHLNLKPLANLSPSTIEVILAVEMYYENEVEFVKDIIKTTGNEVLLGSLT